MAIDISPLTRSDSVNILSTISMRCVGSGWNHIYRRHGWCTRLHQNTQIKSIDILIHMSLTYIVLVYVYVITQRITETLSTRTLDRVKNTSLASCYFYIRIIKQRKFGELGYQNIRHSMEIIRQKNLRVCSKREWHARPPLTANMSICGFWYRPIITFSCVKADNFHVSSIAITRRPIYY